jgi:hypothetical protein
MLGDSAERTRNPIKKAIKRRNAKTVQFSDPTYYEASDVDYTSDEDAEALDGADDGIEPEAGEDGLVGARDGDEIIAAEPSRSAEPVSGGADLVARPRTPPPAGEVPGRGSGDEPPRRDAVSDRNGKLVPYDRPFLTDPPVCPLALICVRVRLLCLVCVLQPRL